MLPCGNGCPTSCPGLRTPSSAPRFRPLAPVPLLTALCVFPRAQGLATGFFTDNDGPLARSLLEVLQETNQTVPGWLQNFAARTPGYGQKSRRGGGRFGGRDARKEFGGGGYGGGGYGGGGNRGYGGGGYGGYGGGGYGGGGYGGGGYGGNSNDAWD